MLVDFGAVFGAEVKKKADQALVAKADDREVRLSRGTISQKGGGMMHGWDMAAFLEDARALDDHAVVQRARRLATDAGLELGQPYSAASAEVARILYPGACC